jgi:hypothetical protein
LVKLLLKVGNHPDCGELAKLLLAQSDAVGKLGARSKRNEHLERGRTCVIGVRLVRSIGLWHASLHHLPLGAARGPSL